MNKTKQISIHYYALFREQRGLASERVSTEATTLAELYAELSARHSFSLPLNYVQVAVNDEFQEWHEPVRDASSVVFIPPVAGG